MANAPVRVPVSLRILTFINFLTLLCSLALLGVGIWLAEQHRECPSRLQWLVIAIAILTFIVSLIGLLGASRRLAWLLWVYISILSVVILLLVIFTVLAFIVKNNGFSSLIHVQGRDFDPGNYSPWVRKQECRARLLHSLRKDWNTVATVSLVVLIFLVLVYFIAWYAFVSALKRHVFSTIV